MGFIIDLVAWAIIAFILYDVLNVEREAQLDFTEELAAEAAEKAKRNG